MTQDMEQQSMEVKDETFLAASKTLNTISEKIERLKFKVDRSLNRYVMSCAKSTARVWVLKALGRNLESDDALDASKARTQFGLVTEELMRTLLELDNIQSNGHEELRTTRKALVKRINEDLLPKADKLFQAGKHLVEFEASLRHKFPTLSLAKKNDSVCDTAVENNEGIMKSGEDKDDGTVMDDKDIMESESEDEEECEEDEQARPAMAQTTEIEEENLRQETETEVPVRIETEQRKARPETLQYRTVDQGSSIVVQIISPFEIDQRDCKISLNRSTGQLTVTIRDQKPLLFDVSNSSLDPMGTTYQLGDHNEVLVDIPKRRRRNNFPSPQRQPARHVRYNADPFFRHQQPAGNGFFRPFGGMFHEPIWG